MPLGLVFRRFAAMPRPAKPIMKLRELFVFLIDEIFRAQLANLHVFTQYLSDFTRTPLYT